MDSDLLDVIRQFLAKPEQNIAQYDLARALMAHIDGKDLVTLWDEPEDTRTSPWDQVNPRNPTL